MFCSVLGFYGSGAQDVRACFGNFSPSHLSVKWSQLPHLLVSTFERPSYDECATQLA